MVWRSSGWVSVTKIWYLIHLTVSEKTMSTNGRTTDTHVMTVKMIKPNRWQKLFKKVSF